ncbi:MAG: RnfH family protein [Limnobacter sp.]|nr:RnfH family protein [Limnobacter sp.]
MGLTVGLIVLGPTDGGVLEQLPTNHTIEPGTTVEAFLLAAGYPLTQVAQWLATRRVAVFGQYALPETELLPGDRIEILDDLRFDPKESRRRRAAHRKQEGRAKRRSSPG